MALYTQTCTCIIFLKSKVVFKLSHGQKKITFTYFECLKSLNTEFLVLNGHRSNTKLIFNLTIYF